MPAVYRGLLLFRFGAIVGGAGVLFFSPSFNVVVSRGAAVPKPVEVAAIPVPVAAPVVPSAVVKPAEPAAPALVAVVPAPAPAPAPMPAAAVANGPVVAPALPDASAAEPALDFKSISEHLILWPNAVTVKTPTVVPVMADGRKVQDLALDAGTVLQVSKVQADGSLEVRAKGAKFEIKSALTDFRVELGKRVSELVAKGTKLDTPFPVAPAPMPAEAAAVAPAAVTPVASVATPVAPKGPLTLAQRVDVLFGNKPAAVAPVAPVAPVLEAAPAPAPAAAPTPDPKAAEKGKDLERKIDQLFK